MNRLAMPNGSPTSQPSLLLNVTSLPCPGLGAQLESFRRAGTLQADLEYSALKLLLHLAADGRLQKLNRRGTLLFHGPPGGGKSTRAKLVAQRWAEETGRGGVLARLNLHGLPSTEFGKTQKNVVRMFAELKELCEHASPVFAIADEIETLATDRDQISGKTSPIDARSAVNAFLEQLDDKPPGCIFIGTTNVVHHLDPAALSRFDFCFRVDAPSSATRLKALASFISIVTGEQNPFRRFAKSSIEPLAEATKKASFRELESLVMWAIVLHDCDLSLTAEQLVTAARFAKKSVLKGGVR